MSNYWEDNVQLPEQPAESNNSITPQLPLYNADEVAKANSQFPNDYAASPYARQPNPQAFTSPTNPSEKPHKERKRSIGAGVISVCVILSLCAGFLGSFAANRLFPANSPSSDSASTMIEAPVHEGAADDNSLATLSTVVTATKDSVVEITTEAVTTSNFFGQYVTQGAGSGVIIREDGYIVTNNHVVTGAAAIRVTLSNGEKYDATLVGTDQKTDLAVIKIELTGLTPAVLGNTEDMHVGDSVIAIGNPLGSLGGTVTNGIISALDREILVQGQTMKLLQTSAAINPGNSGGGLFNMYGELIGIVNAKPTDAAAGADSSIDGLGFAIPIDTVKDVVTQIIDNGYVTGRAIMGLSVYEILDAQTAQEYGVDRYGVYITTISPGLGAQKAGLIVGDCVVSIEGNVVETTADITSVLDQKNVGDTIELQVIREGKMITAKVVLSESVPTAETPQIAG